MTICFHKWAKWGKPYRAFVPENNLTSMTMVQTRLCEKCGRLGYLKTVVPLPHSGSDLPCAN